MRFYIVLSFCAGLALGFGCSSAPNQSRPDASITASLPKKPAMDAAGLLQIATQPNVPLRGEGWTKMFDENSLAGWRITDFAGHGEVEIQSGMTVLGMGDPFTGINYTNSFPKLNYEISLEAIRLTGSDFFCGLTFPIGEDFCSLIVGGWGGSLLGISSLDGQDASENETTRYISFDDRRWYRIRLRVTKDRIETWLDDKKVVDANTEGKRISVRAGDIELSKPLGIASWQTAAAFRNLQYRQVAGPEGPPVRQK